MRSSRLRLLLSAAALLTLTAMPARAQAQADTRAILERLERLEQQNRELAEEVRALRNALGVTRSATITPGPAVITSLRSWCRAPES